MITFLPYPDFRQSLECLDRQRLNRQRLEAWQIYDALTNEASIYRKLVKGPAVRMWAGFTEALAEYYDTCLTVWVERGYRNEKLQPLGVLGGAKPIWWGDRRVHGSHRSQLLGKLPGYYRAFGWVDAPGQPYFWPV